MTQIKNIPFHKHYIFHHHIISNVEYYNDKYFEEYICEAKWERELIRKCIKKGFSDSEISDVHDIFYWEEGLRAAHPYDAYHMNTMITIKLVRKEMEEEDGQL